MKMREDVVMSAFLNQVESAIRYGWHRAHKHVDNPTEQTIQDEISHQVSNTILEWIDYVREGEFE